jgi:hypothetical protein
LALGWGQFSLADPFLSSPSLSFYKNINRETMKKIISIDIAAKDFKSLKVEKIQIDYTNDLVQIFYDNCLSPIIVDVNDYELLLNGHVVELHHGEVALVVED